MYNSHTQETNTKWSFLTTLLLIGLSLILGLVAANSQIFQPRISAATADRMNVETGIEYQKAQIEIQAMLRQAERDQLLSDQEIANQIENDRLMLDLRQKANNALAVGMNLGIVVILAMIAALLAARLFPRHLQDTQQNHPAQFRTTNQPTALPPRRGYHTPSLEAQRAREIERLRNKDRLHSQKNPLENTQTTWSAQDQKSHDTTRDLPHAE